MNVKRSFVELTYYETYYFANVVKNVLEDQFEYIRHLEDFYGDFRYLNYASPFPRISAFHSFIHFLIDEVIGDDVENMQLDVRQDNADRFKSVPSALNPHPSKLPVNLALDRFGITHKSFLTRLESRGCSFLDATDDDVDAYYDDFRIGGELETLLERATAEVFFVLFQNRSTLLLFNQMMARRMGEADQAALGGSTYGGFFARPGVLRRVAIPSWVRRAVYFRDRGMCVICATDLSGTLSVGSEENYDHIVPLAAGGLNDVTNIQLLCKGCNSRKRAGEAATTNRYEAWYSERD
jgi:hypothetical protein